MLTESHSQDKYEEYEQYYGEFYSGNLHLDQDELYLNESTQDESCQDEPQQDESFPIKSSTQAGSTGDKTSSNKG
ncbi:23400_t:CDS:1, partial [Dentiscutata erythropus]